METIDYLDMATQVAFSVLYAVPVDLAAFMSMMASGAALMDDVKELRDATQVGLSRMLDWEMGDGGGDPDDTWEWEIVFQHIGGEGVRGALTLWKAIRNG